MFKISELKQLCKEYQLSPSKQYGQNFLLSEGPLLKMIEAAGIGKKDTVVEIGPGFGVLTFALAQKAGKVIAFEIEKKLKDFWHKKCQEHKNIEIVWGNFLKEANKYLNKLGDYIVVANLPYQITGKVFRILLEAENKPKKMVIMTQKEVAERVVSRSPRMSLLSVSVQYFGEPKIVSKLPAGSFWPKPKVDSAILLIDNIKEPPKSNHFFKLTKAGFVNPRKQVWRNISRELNLDPDSVKKTLKEIIGNEKVRAQEISVEQWRQISAKY